MILKQIIQQFFLIGLGCSQLTAQANPIIFKFNEVGQMIIDAKIANNNQKYPIKIMFDTAAEISVIDESIIKHYGFKPIEYVTVNNSLEKYLIININEIKINEKQKIIKKPENMNINQKKRKKKKKQSDMNLNHRFGKYQDHPISMILALKDISKDSVFLDFENCLLIPNFDKPNDTIEVPSRWRGNGLIELLINIDNTERYGLLDTGSNAGVHEIFTTSQAFPQKQNGKIVSLGIGDTRIDSIK